MEHGRAPQASDWADLEMVDDEGGGGFVVDVPLSEAGRFEAKAYLLPGDGAGPRWADGDGNARVHVAPAWTAGVNSIYTVFARLFGPEQEDAQTFASAAAELEEAGYAALPPSGTLRDVGAKLDTIIGEMRFGIILLLPTFPTPGRYGKMGAYGSPFAALDFFSLNPALAEFDRHLAPLQQFDEFATGVHCRGARLFLDVPINHTGWGSKLQNEHPEWFARTDTGEFVSPGAWGVVWPDLIKLDYSHRELWQYMAEVFLFWCRRGVDGFRCDAGHMVPAEVWRYIIARVRREFSETVFLLEGLGGEPSVCAQLIAEGGLDWDYSELFHRRSRAEIERDLPVYQRASDTSGLLVHFVETHDNSRVAAHGARFASMRTALAALSSNTGAWGITDGVEWFADESIDVHGRAPLHWGREPNQVEAIGRLNALLASHPAFQAGSRLEMIQCSEGNYLVLRRTAPGEEGELALVLVLVNLDTERESVALWRHEDSPGFHAGPCYDLLGGGEVVPERRDYLWRCRLAPGAVVVATNSENAVARVEASLSAGFRESDRGELQRLRALAVELGGEVRGTALDRLRSSPAGFCRDLAGDGYARVTRWSWPGDVRRELLLPPGHALLVEAPEPFEMQVRERGGRTLCRRRSLPRAEAGHFMALAPGALGAGERQLELAVYRAGECRRDVAVVHALAPFIDLNPIDLAVDGESAATGESFALCTNGRGAASQVRAAYGEIRSQYDCLIGANLDPDHPVDRRVMFTRCRAWLSHCGRSQSLDAGCLSKFVALPCSGAIWEFDVPLGGDFRIKLTVTLKVVDGENAIDLEFVRGRGDQGPEEVRLILRPDVEDRVCHDKTTAWEVSAERKEDGFAFPRGGERQLRVRARPGRFIDEPEWLGVEHPVDAERGFGDRSELFSPGYFEAPLAMGQGLRLSGSVSEAGEGGAIEGQEPAAPVPSAVAGPENLARMARDALDAFIVSRDDSLTIIAGYPWFLDWGRDTMICLRGLIAAGEHALVAQILHTFARFEEGGTIPNMVRGGDASDRDTSDAPLWFVVVCDELVRADPAHGEAFLTSDCGGRTVAAAIRSIATHYVEGTPNGIRMDPDSGLVFSPPHFTWMDTNHPPGTPRTGYPIEIQALWHAALQSLARIDPEGGWAELAAKLRQSIVHHFVRREGDFVFLSDCLHAEPGQGAAEATPDDHLRPNQLFAITLGAIDDLELAGGIVRACDELLVPGAIRTLADRPVAHALPYYWDGALLNDPHRPYWGQYSGPEDTRRKPAYHNGTAWCWVFPSYAEALYLTFGEPAREAALALLSSCSPLFESGCIGQLPEVLDGDAPHAQKGCGAQAWSASELLRVLKLLQEGARGSLARNIADAGGRGSRAHSSNL